MDDVLLPLALATATTVLLYAGLTAILAQAQRWRLRRPGRRQPLRLQVTYQK